MVKQQNGGPLVSRIQRKDEPVGGLKNRSEPKNSKKCETTERRASRFKNSKKIQKRKEEKEMVCFRKEDILSKKKSRLVPKNSKKWCSSVPRKYRRLYNNEFFN